MSSLDKVVRQGPIILLGPQNWEPWLESKKSEARQYKIWKYVDPSIERELLPVLTPPVKPTIESVRSSTQPSGNTQSLSQSSRDPSETPSTITSTSGQLLYEAQRVEDQKALDREYKEWEWEMKDYRKQDEALLALCKNIQETVRQEYMVYTYRCETPYDMLSRLQQKVAPSDNHRKRELTEKWLALHKPKKGIEVSHWLMKWETLYEDLKALDIVWVQGDQPAQDFLNSLENISPNFYERFKQDESLGISRTFYEIINAYRTYRRATQSSKPQYESGFASTSYDQDKKQKDKDKSPTLGGRKVGQRSKPKCKCGIEHFFGECPYYNPKARTKGWKGDKKIQEKITEHLAENEWIQANIVTFNHRSESKREKEKKEKEKELAEEDKSKDRTESAFTFDTFSGGDTVFTASIAKLQSGQTALAAPTSFSTSHDYRTITHQLANSTILDSGATVHVCNDRTRFLDFRKAEEDDVLLAGESIIQIEGFGTVEISVAWDKDRYRTIQLQDTAFVPQFHLNVASLRRFIRKDVHWESRTCRLERGGKTLALTPVIHDHWVLEYKPLQNQESYDDQISYEDQVAFPASSRKIHDKLGDMDQWHSRLGHLDHDAIKYLPESTKGSKITGDPKSYDKACPTCRLVNAKEIVSRVPATRAYLPFERLHWDIIQMNPGLDNSEYASHFQCDRTTMNYTFPIQNKSEHSLLWSFQQMIPIAESLGFIVRYLHTDGERGVGIRFKSYLVEKGIRLEVSTPDTKQQNGKAERSGAIIVRKVTALRQSAGLPEQPTTLPAYLWPELFEAATYLLNRSPIRGFEWQTPYGVLGMFLGLMDPRPVVSHLVAYGCRAYVLDKRIDKLDRTEPRAKIGFLVGYKSRTIFRVWIPQEKKVISARDVTFDESRFYNPVLDNYKPLGQVIYTRPVPQLQITEVSDEEEETQEPDQTDQEPQDQNRTIQESESQGSQDTLQPSKEQGQEPTQLLTPEKTPEIPLNTTNDSQQGSYEQTENGLYREIGLDLNKDNILTEKRTRKPSRRSAYQTALYQDFGGFLTAFQVNPKQRAHRTILPEPPERWNKLPGHPYEAGFREAAKQEYDRLIARGTFKHIPGDQTKGKFVIPLMWVFTYKCDSDGFLQKFKARIVVRGDLEPKSPNEEVYAATLAGRTFRAMMAIACYFDLEVFQYDAVNAFVNAKIDEDVFVRCPEGFEVQGKHLLLLRALYGLRRSPLLWFNELSRTLKGLDLKPVSEAHCLFINSRILVFFYVDDICVLCHKSELPYYQSFHDKLIKSYELRKLENFEWFLGIRIVRNRSERKLWLCLDAYIDKITHKYNLTDRKPPSTPLPTEDLVPYEGQATKQQIYAFQCRVGSIIYPSVLARPDIAFAGQKLSEFLVNPGPKHLEAADRTIAYLNGSRTMAIEYNNLSYDPLFLCASDAAFADNSETRRSTEGYYFQLFGGPIDWRSTKQKTVTTSTTEAELYALSHTAGQLYWWQRFFNAISLDLKDQFPLQCDNLQTVRLLIKDSPKLITKLKHVDIHQHWLRQEVQLQNLQVEWIPTHKMKADGFTKNLPRQKHEHFVRQLGLIDIKAYIAE